MTATLRLALTADLHWGVRPSGDEATTLLIDFLRQEPPDVLVLAGDAGAGRDFANCLALFDDLACQKALVPGNHDIWVEDADPRGDSLQVYRDYLPSVCAAHGFHYLDQGPLLLPQAGLAVAGSINWYDYSWSIEALQQQFRDWEDRVRTKRFSRGRHNDARFVRWPLDDARFTGEVVGKLEEHLQQARSQVPSVIVVTHHPAYYSLSFPRGDAPLTPDGLLWDAFSGNRACEELLTRHEEDIPLVFSGHTHRARTSTLGKIRGYNIGGDYHFKRLLLVDWPAGTVTAHVFGREEG
ncbi:MAG TPA: metallophosphoesterase [Gemmataceae bacterium]|nr:metallophosphoesterase [Gemmataceae bacterium]